ncbi:MAG TPA: hypothetical protein VEG30_02360 [Terriglobales bacterium]|nr:hypothetical protein [Terriglobales bacterium]
MRITPTKTAASTRRLQGTVVSGWRILSMQDDLTTIRDDMTAFIEGHGMQRFHGYVSEEVQSVMWDMNGNPESWKDFVELAKSSGSSFLTMNHASLDRDDVDFLVDRLRNAPYANEEDVEEARWLRAYVGKTGFVQLGFPYQGTLFLCELSTEWYDRYQRLLDMAEDFGGITYEADQDDER